MLCHRMGEFVAGHAKKLLTQTVPIVTRGCMKDYKIEHGGPLKQLPFMFKSKSERGVERTTLASTRFVSG